MNYDKLVQSILDIGEEMVTCGAEVSRVEDSIMRMCHSYGMHRVNVFIITSNIQLTLEAPDGRIVTQIRRMVRYSVNFDRLDYLNDLSRYICANHPDIDEIQEKLDEVMNRPGQPRILSFLSLIFVASGFTVFFGGNFGDAIAAAIMGITIGAMDIILSTRERNQIVYNFISSVVAGSVAIALVSFGIGVHADLIMIGGIMLLIPGIAMTNAMRDMLIGDIASGLLRLCNAIIVSIAIACGFAFSIIVLGGALL